MILYDFVPAVLSSPRVRVRLRLHPERFCMMMHDLFSKNWGLENYRLLEVPMEAGAVFLDLVRKRNGVHDTRRTQMQGR